MTPAEVDALLVEMPSLVRLIFPGSFFLNELDIDTFSQGLNIPFLSGATFRASLSEALQACSLQPIWARVALGRIQEEGERGGENIQLPDLTIEPWITYIEKKATADHPVKDLFTLLMYWTRVFVSNTSFTVQSV